MLESQKLKETARTRRPVAAEAYESHDPNRESPPLPPVYIVLKLISTDVRLCLPYSAPPARAVPHCPARLAREVRVGVAVRTCRRLGIPILYPTLSHVAQCECTGGAVERRVPFSYAFCFSFVV